VESRKIKTFEDIDAWKRAHALCIRIYRAMEDSREFIFRGHIFKTVMSVSSNIAEGFERQSGREYIQFLNYAKGSCGELRSQLYVAKDLGLVEDTQVREMVQEAKEISSMISGLIRSVKKRTYAKGSNENSNNF